MPQSAQSLDQLREGLRHKYYILRNEEVYVYWAKLFVRWLGCNGQVPQQHQPGVELPDALATMDKAMLTTFIKWLRL